MSHHQEKSTFLQRPCDPALVAELRSGNAFWVEGVVDRQAVCQLDAVGALDDVIHDGVPRFSCRYSKQRQQSASKIVKIRMSVEVIASPDSAKELYTSNSIDEEKQRQHAADIE